MKSIITDDLKHCIISGSPNVAIHHCLEGTANRRLSDSDGLVVPLAPELHNEGGRAPLGCMCDAHHCKNMSTLLHMIGQLAWENERLSRQVAFFNGMQADDVKKEVRERFVSLYGKNYL